MWKKQTHLFLLYICYCSPPPYLFIGIQNMNDVLLLNNNLFTSVIWSWLFYQEERKIAFPLKICNFLMSVKERKKITIFFFFFFVLELLKIIQRLLITPVKHIKFFLFKSFLNRHSILLCHVTINQYKSDWSS